MLVADYMSSFKQFLTLQKKRCLQQVLGHVSTLAVYEIQAYYKFNINCRHYGAAAVHYHYHICFYLRV